MSQVTSPFKFLDSYSREDADIFFGREQETEALYDALSGVKHLLVYGPSGAGKTSLIECGLRNQFSDADWFALTIRKGVNISGSVFSAINEALDEKISLHRKTGLPKDDSIDFGHAIESLFAERYQPIYLLFDQFEELLISGVQAEKEDFFTRLNRLIRYKVPCRVMLIMREEFIGHLSEFEPLCPSIFQHRFRLEKMRKDNVKEVIRKTLDAPKYAASFAVEDSEGLAGSILSKLPDEKREIELAHVQVFLSELWDRAHEGGEGAGALPMLRQSLIREGDDLEGVLDSFLKKQLKELEAVHGEKIPLEVLAAMISERHTKLQVSEEDLKKDLEDEGIALPKDLPLLLRDLESRRIIRTIKADEKTQYEISHDVLALVVGQNLTKEMQLREEATGVYKVYEGKQGYLSLEDLDHIRPYQQYKALPEALARKVEESIVHNARKDTEKLEEAQRQAEQERKLRGKAEEKEKQARQRTRLAAAVSIVALALALFAGWSYLQAQKARESADLSAKEALKQKAEAEAAGIIADSNATVALQKTKEAEDALTLADKNLQIAKAEEARATAALEQVKKEKAATEEQRKIAENNARIAQERREEAESLREQAELALDRATQEKNRADAERDKAQIALENLEKKNADVVKLILQNAERDVLNLRYEDALEKIKGAASLDALKPDVTRSWLEIAFWHAETGDSLRATTLLDSIADFAGIKISHAKSLRENMKTMDVDHFAFLFNKKYYPEMVKVEGETFWMGCDEKVDPNCRGDETLHQQEVSSFWMAKYETTVWQFALYCAARGKDLKGFLVSTWTDPGDNPVVNVRWYDAVKYANWVSKQKGYSEAISKDDSGNYKIDLASKGYRLPTEAEWEYAAKGGRLGVNTETIYSGSNSLDSVGWFSGNNNIRTRPVGQKKANPLGLYDMSGNVWEWCWDWYGSYPKNPVKDYEGPEEGSHRVLRGGGWGNFAESCRVAYRYHYYPVNRYIPYGFRVVFVP